MDNQQPRRILVAGATGNLGRALIPVLDARGCEVVALVRPGRQSRLESLENKIKNIVSTEVTTPDIAPNVFSGVHTVISSIGITRQRDGLSYDQVDFAGNLNLLREAERYGLRRFIYVSVAGADKDAYDLVVVLIRKNLLGPVFKSLSRAPHVRNILFMGNNALGFDQYLRHIPEEKVLLGFPGAGGSRQEGVVRYVDSEKPSGKRIPITIGEMDGRTKNRTKQIKSLFEISGVPVNVVSDIDGWLKYHVALVSPIANALHMQDCDNYALAGDKEGLRVLVRACKEGGNVLRALGYGKRQPFKWNLFYWLPEFMTAKVFQGLLNSRFAEIAFSKHAKAAPDEMRSMADEFGTLIDQTSLPTPNIDRLRRFLA